MRGNHTIGLVSIVGAIALLAACSSAASSVTRSPIDDHASLAAHSFVASPNATGPFIYGCAYLANECVWFVKGQPAIAGVLSGLNGPQGVGVDPRTGDLYIAESGGSDIKVFAPNSTTLLATYADPDESPVDVAVNPRGGFVVANTLTSESHPGSVSVYDSSGHLVRTITDSNVYVGVSVTVDEHDLVTFCFYRSNPGYNGECDDFPGAREPGTERVGGWGPFTGGGTFDSAGNLVVADIAARRMVTYNGGNSCGSSKLGGAGDAFRLAFSRDERLMYVADVGTGTIREYPFNDCESGTISERMRYDAGLYQQDLVGVAVTPGARL